ncbi:hypothetical protein Tco_0325513, partial [Tanacetum coccineum]
HLSLRSWRGHGWDGMDLEGPVGIGIAFGAEVDHQLKFHQLERDDHFDHLDHFDLFDHFDQLDHFGQMNHQFQ